MRTCFLRVNASWNTSPSTTKLDEFAGMLAYVRVYSGVLRRGDTVLLTSDGTTRKVGRLEEIHAETREEVDELPAGSVGAVLGLREARSGATLCTPSAPLELAPIPRPDPVVWMSIEPASGADRVALSEALNHLATEDPSIRLRFDEETGQSLIGGQGELHLEVARTRLRRKHSVEAIFGEPEVAYRETVREQVNHRVRLKKQTGGPGMFAEVELMLRPADRGTGICFDDSITGGAIPREFIAAVRAGVEDAATAGVFDYPVTDVHVDLLDGAVHPNDSSAMAFRLCGKQAFHEALERASAVVLEPMMELTVTTPRESVGDVIGELERRRGRVALVEPDGHAHRVAARIPLAATFGFSDALRTLASGRATHHTQLAGYEPVKR